MVETVTAQTWDDIVSPGAMKCQVVGSFVKVAPRQPKQQQPTWQTTFYERSNRQQFTSISCLPTCNFNAQQKPLCKNMISSPPFPDQVLIVFRHPRISNAQTPINRRDLFHNSFQITLSLSVCVSLALYILLSHPHSSPSEKHRGSTSEPIGVLE